MRIRVQFGLIDNRDVNWYQPVENFPTLINFLGKNYEWVMYDKDISGAVDMILIFSELHSYDPDYTTVCPIWNEMFGESRIMCDCGAKFTSFPWDHMRMCKKWTKW